jgi:hypothetical protein
MNRYNFSVLAGHAVISGFTHKLMTQTAAHRIRKSLTDENFSLDSP